MVNFHHSLVTNLQVVSLPLPLPPFPSWYFSIWKFLPMEWGHVSFQGIPFWKGSGFYKREAWRCVLVGVKERGICQEIHSLNNSFLIAIPSIRTHMCQWCFCMSFNFNATSVHRTKLLLLYLFISPGLYSSLQFKASKLTLNPQTGQHNLICIFRYQSLQTG